MVSFLSFFTDFGVPKKPRSCFSTTNGESFVIGCDGSSDSMTMKCGKCIEEVGVDSFSETDSESGLFP